MAQIQNWCKSTEEVELLKLIALQYNPSKLSTFLTF